MKYPGVQKIIDVLKAVDNSPTSAMGFDMGHFYPARHMSKHPCGTACCIAGWASYCLAKTPYGNSGDLVEFCNLPPEVSQSCYGNSIFDLTGPRFPDDLLDVEYSDLTLDMAIRVLEIFRDTGEVKWTEVYLEMRGDDANVPSIS